MASLPTLSRQASSPEDGSREEFLDTLATGLRMVLVLILPAVIGLFVLSEPVVTLVFEHGDFTSLDTEQTAQALRIYLLGTTFAAIDLPLVYAFYARKNTLTPALVGVLGVGLYLVAALIPALLRELRMIDLVLANSVQLTGHALLMLWLINRRVGSLRGRGLGRTTVKALIASLAAGGLAFATARWLLFLFPLQTLLHEVIVVGGAALVGLAVYGLLVALLGIEEVGMVVQLLRRRLRTGRGH
jgi:putative peptidoglycan lipid II flippase